MPTDWTQLQTLDPAGFAALIGMGEQWVRDEVRAGRLPHLCYGGKYHFLPRHAAAFYATHEYPQPTGLTAVPALQDTA
jgi:hypothetical protein